ncbi:MAG: hypothetical protein WC848_04635 [Parcubacteria group bacterium]
MKRAYIASMMLVMAFFSSALVRAAEVSGEEKEKTFLVSAELGVFSSYINENTGEYTNGLMTTAGFSLTHNPSGLYFGALSYISEKGFDEVDVYLGDSFKIKGLTFDLGVVYYNVDTLSDMEGDSIGAYAGVKFQEVYGFVPFAYLEKMFSIREEYIGRGGFVWKVGAEKKDFLKIGEWLIALKLEAGGNSGIYDTDPMLVSFARCTISTPIKICGLEVSPLIIFQQDFGGIAETGSRVIGGVNIAVW